MPAPYSQDLRDRVLAAFDRGETGATIAEMFQVSESWANRCRQVRREKGRTTPLPTGGRRHSKIDKEKLAALVREKPDSTLKELRDELGVRCVESAICMALKKLGLSYKKRRSTPRSRTAPTSRPRVSSGVSASPGPTPAG